MRALASLFMLADCSTILPSQASTSGIR
uniref:Uncharacterized protein n=1 Tax=Rhizophora mucronata TaxID=61149 RepID=A0A2P2QIK5_RHIMU